MHLNYNENWVRIEELIGEAFWMTISLKKWKKNRRKIESTMHLLKSYRGI